MNYFLILLGLIVIIITGPYVFKDLIFREENLAPKNLASENQKNQKEVDKDYVPPALLEYLQSLEDRLEAVTDTLAEVTSKVNDYSAAKSKGEQDFGEVLLNVEKNNKPLSINEQIYQAYLKGKSVTELAREFGKGKGEIELILNLMR